MKSANAFRNFAWGVLAYNLAVIAWGAYVRATFSGAGCGSHWPLCNGELLPDTSNLARAIEFSHRMSSGIALLAILVMLVWAFRRYPKGSPVRLGAALSACFIVMEAALGAGLVLFELVDKNSSPDRAIAMSLHLTNTFILLIGLTLTAWWATVDERSSWKGQGAVGWALGFGLVGTLILAISGAVTALGDTLLNAGHLSSTHFLVQLRQLHPLIAMSVVLYLVLIAGLVSYLRPSPQVRKLGGLVAGLALTQTILGAINIFLQAPVWMQMTHLLLADAVWIALILFTVSAFSVSVEHVEVVDDAPAPEAESPPATGLALIKMYVLLTKPRVISLLLFTTITAMFIGAQGWPGFWLLLAVSLGGYMAAGAANAINMVMERDLDLAMKRTSKRPTVTQEISSRNALLFGLGLGFGSFALLWGSANLLSAMLALAGLVFYVIVYTLLLKRRTWHNIVIGGAAGAFPPLVGYAAVTGELTPLAWCLFAIIFVWTPVHFWALALLIKDDYARAGVPMLPVVMGERATVIQIGLYAILTSIISVLPMIQSQVGGMYLWTAAVLNLFLLLRCMQLFQHTDRPHAVRLYKYSMLYLALLFLGMAIDRAAI